jgi:hypothetical protein
MCTYNIECLQQSPITRFGKTNTHGSAFEFARFARFWHLPRAQMLPQGQNRIEELPKREMGD